MTKGDLFWVEMRQRLVVGGAILIVLVIIFRPNTYECLGALSALPFSAWFWTWFHRKV